VKDEFVSLSSERGSALVIAVLVSVILALLGISFLLMGETESRIALNEKRSAQALYAAEAGSRAVKRWFDYPGAALRFPSPAVVDRTQRMILDENDPYDSADVTPADGVIGSFPYYKQGVDRNGDGVDDLFDRPYRPGMLHSLMGTSDGPDLRIDDEDALARTFLEDLTRTFLGDFPGEGGGIHARISRIDIYAPPYIQVGANWSRYGLATVKVVARLYKSDGNGDRVIAEHEVEAVLGEAPYNGPYGPLHSCADLTFTTQPDLTVHWGAMTAVGTMNIMDPALRFRMPQSLPREEPAMPHVDPLWNGASAAAFSTFKTVVEQGRLIDDPWFRIISGGWISGYPQISQPYPPAGGSPPAACAAPHFCNDDSNIIHGLPLVSCPGFDYDIWKLTAISGESDVRYFVWSGADTFRENGAGPARSFQHWTAGEEGVYFFDTTNRQPPIDADGDGFLDNLTPAVTVTAGGWYFRGLIYLNAVEFKLDHSPAAQAGAVVSPPGEPFQDADQDGVYDSGEAWINLAYPTTSGTINAQIEAVADTSGSPVRESRGPEIADVPLSLEGIVYTNGRFEATGEGTVYGSVIARQGVAQEDASGTQPTPHIYWNESIAGDFPPPGWRLPRTVVTAWRTQR
jgi:hypothetical protein